jgi:hypothetical protein
MSATAETTVLTIPDSPIIHDAMQLLTGAAGASIANHSMRRYIRGISCEFKRGRRR